MSTTPPRPIIDKPTLSEAWLDVIKLLTTPAADSGAPLVVSFTEFDSKGFPVEIPAVRKKLEAALNARGKVSVDANASMIFPIEAAQMLEMRIGREATIHELTEHYLRLVFPRLRAVNKRANGKGTYFYRMVNFGGDPAVRESRGTNQLEKLVGLWRSHPHIVQSLLQLAIRDPLLDITNNPRPFFPCLQQVSFAYDLKGGISVTGYYPTQYAFDRAYGNYLGLSHLGWFVARAIRKTLVRVNCICAHPLLGGDSSEKRKLREEFHNLLYAE